MKSLLRRPAPPISAAETSPNLVEIAMRLRAISHDDGSIDAAQVKVIGLDDIRKAAGARWPRMREQVCAGSLAILSKHTGPKDVVIPAGDGFLIVLAEAAAGHNEARCEQMRQALSQFYLGDNGLQTLRPDLTTRTLTADGFADLLAFESRSDQEVRAQSAQLELIARIGICGAADCKVIADLVCPVHRTEQSARLAYNSDFVLDGRHHGRTFHDTDQALLQVVAEALAGGSIGSARPMGITVHAATLQRRRSREQFLTALATLPAEWRRKGFVSIAEIERGTPLMSITEWCFALRAMVSRICLDFHYSDHAITGIGATGAWAAGFHLPAHTGAQVGVRAARTLDQIDFWSKRVRGQGMRLTVNGFHDRAFLHNAARLGVEIATGDCLQPIQPMHRAALCV